ncbi:hypothetical protein OEZ85_012516 [Tetradesmus obliquus]|uniref:Uncharacterized protein n=1 Tax=Tetradesmus obliquus TaxID=3088 RepID=A0ABY8TXN1_TETOB|nr:hypothetical protein OEZ85_012516 [Tetradesmus obliquus]
MEFTPLYFGAPALHDRLRPITLGGGLAEPLAMHTLAPRKKAAGNTGNETVDVYLLRAGSTSSLVHAMGISSSAIPLMLAPNNLLASQLLNGHILNYWNLWDYKQTLLSFVDEGAVDDLGVMPLLRRGVTNIVICLATHENPDSTIKAFAKSEYALAGLFGAVPLNAKDAKGQPLKLHDTNSPATWSSMSQVFPAEGFPVLFDQYKASFLQGGAHIFNATYQVLPNSFHGVKGNYKVSVLWLLNGRSSQWEAALPQETQQWLAPKRNASSGPYGGYPNVYNVLQAPAQLVSLLSQQASWAVREKQSLVQDWVAAAAQ